MSAPLPWSVALDSEIPDAGSVLVLDANNEVVCDVGVLGRTREENEANARLIVGLLATLIRCRDGMKRVLAGRGFDTLDELAGEVLQSEVDVANALIARATGAPMVGRERSGVVEDVPGRGNEGAAERRDGRSTVHPRPGAVAEPSAL